MNVFGSQLLVETSGRPAATLVTGPSAARCLTSLCLTLEARYLLPARGFPCVTLTVPLGLLKIHYRCIPRPLVIHCDNYLGRYPMDRKMRHQDSNTANLRWIRSPIAKSASVGHEIAVQQLADDKEVSPCRNRQVQAQDSVPQFEKHHEATSAEVRHIVILDRLSRRPMLTPCSCFLTFSSLQI